MTSTLTEPQYKINERLWDERRIENAKYWRVNLYSMSYIEIVGEARLDAFDWLELNNIKFKFEHQVLDRHGRPAIAFGFFSDEDLAYFILKWG